MISKLFIENYRSIQKAELLLGKINVLTGANNSGKSSVLYAALTLKSLVSNPNRSLDAILTLPFINLGGFEQIVHLKDKKKQIKIGVESDVENLDAQYFASLGLDESELFFNGVYPFENDLSLNISFPYPANKIVKSSNLVLAKKINKNPLDENLNPLADSKPRLADSLAAAMESLGYTNNKITANVETSWNGFHAESIVQTQQNIKVSKDQINSINIFFNSPASEINKVDFTPTRRGFTKAFFGVVQLSDQITTEEEIATLIANDRDLESSIAFYLEKIVDRTFQVRFTIGTANFYLQTRDKKTGFTSDLVNEGSGINQLVTILAKTLKKGSDFICIDEPEIHLHPIYINKLAEVMVEIAENEGKQFLISTHNEHLVSSLLNLLITPKALLAPEDLKVFYCSKPKKETQIELQSVNEKGQIEGGFKSFLDAELAITKKFFKIR